MKYNRIIAAVGFICALLGAIVIYYFSATDPTLVTRALITVYIGILGLIGAYLFDYDYRMAVAEYIFAAIGIYAAIGTTGFYALIFFFIAAIVAFLEREKSDTFNDTVKKAQKNSRFDIRIFWIIPVMTILLGVLSIIL